MAVLTWQGERNTGNEQIWYPFMAGNPTFMQHQSDPNQYHNKIHTGRGKRAMAPSICACAGVDVWPKPGELSLWNALWLQEGTKQSFDTAYYGFQPSYFSQDIPWARDKLCVDKLHVNKLQNSKMYGWNKSDSLEYKQASLRLAVDFRSGQKKSEYFVASR